MPGTVTRALALACMGWILVGCTERGRELAGPADQGPPLAAKRGEAGPASDHLTFQVRLGSVGESRSRGVVQIKIAGGNLTVAVHATELEPVQHIPQHIHVNPTCQDGGAVFINLDAGLTVPGEGAPIGEAFPLSNRAGVVNYSASRPLSELLQAANTYLGTDLTSVDELVAWLDLENRNVHMHFPVAPFTPVNCGEVERLN